MSKGKSDKIRYKPYEQSQTYLIPPSVDELIPERHLVRLVSEVIDEMQVESILRKYQVGGGASRYHPAMMTKVFVYGYMTKVCSSRMLAKAIRENVMFMWLSGGQKPDFRTLNDFRGKILKGVMEEVFVTAIKMLEAKGYIKLENYFVDGTKIESASGRYTFVWKKTIERNDQKLDEKLRAYIKMADDIWEDENADYGERDLEELGSKEAYTSEDVQELAEALKERIEKLEGAGEEESKKKVKKELKTVEKDYLPRKKRYETAKELLGKRNSYSKTDHDATFMRMKEDHMRNGQTKPGYNIQIGCENSFIVGYDVFQTPADTTTLKPHLERQKERLGKKPERVIGDAGYGGEENYQYCEDEGIIGLMKYGMYRTEQTKKYKTDIWRTENWQYDKNEKYYVCPEGRKLSYQESTEHGNRSGYLVQVDIYHSESCAGCPSKEHCTKAEERTIERNENMLRLKEQAKALLADEENKKIMKQRSVEVETVFGQIKGNQGYRRFLLRGLKKVAAEWGLFSLGYDIKQLFRLTP